MTFDGNCYCICRELDLVSIASHSHTIPELSGPGCRSPVGIIGRVERVLTYRPTRASAPVLPLTDPHHNFGPNSALDYKIERAYL